MVRPFFISLPCLLSPFLNVSSPQSMKSDLKKAIGHRVLVSDGAMGTMLESMGASQECNDELCLSRPDVIMRVHRAYLEAGSDIVTTNTFGATRIVLDEHGLAGRAREINLAAVSIAREAADVAGGTRFVAGELGPTSKLPTLGHIPFSELEDAYLEQVSAFLEGGVDLVIAQTCQDPLQLKAAASAWMRACDGVGRWLPLIASVTVERSGTMLLGTDVLAALTALAPYGPSAFGLNCATGPDDMDEHISALKANSPFAIICRPNAGMPENVGGKPVYRLSPEDFSARLKDFVERYGVSIVGGCCGTTPDHIASLARQVGGKKVGRRKAGGDILSSVASLYSHYGLDQEPKPFIVAEQTNVNGSKKFRELLLASDYDAMADVGRGAGELSHALDLCVAFAGRDEPKDMAEVTQRLALKSQVPIMVDSTNPEALERALALIPGRPIVNSINLEDVDKARVILKIARRFGAAVVALTIDESGMAKDARAKVGIARRLVKLARDEGLKVSDLLVDPLTFTLASGDADLRGAGKETLSAVREIKRKLPESKTILGVSNISFGLPQAGRAFVTSAFLHRAVESGLDAAIINPAKIVPIERVPEDALAIANRLIDGDDSEGDPLAAFIEYLESRGGVARVRRDAREPASPEEALKGKVFDGSREGLLDIVEELVASMDPRDIINRILLPSMQEVGEKFGSGRMPLPFVLQSAETMRAAIDLITPHMKGEEVGERGTIVLATVRGDVHDIGKNLVDAILTNNGFKVVNLGIKQPATAIVEAARAQAADAIGLSGLLVSSTEIMREDLVAFKKAGLGVPVLCGGAALTKSFVEEALSNAYGAEVVYCPDAFSGLKAMERYERK